jgi:hypothetical protein
MLFRDEVARMRFPDNAQIGSKHQDPPPTATQLSAVLLCQNVLRQAGLHTAADLLPASITNSEWVRTEDGWRVTAEALDSAKIEVEELLAKAKAENFVELYEIPDAITWVDSEP